MAERISVVGLGKLGLCLAVCYAERGFETLGVDVEEHVADSVNRGIAPWSEPGLDDLLARHGGHRLRATTYHRAAIEETDITFVLVATPSNPDGSFSNRFVQSALSSLGEALRRSTKKHHLFVISSTVMPGSTEASFIPILEKSSGRRLNQDFAVCYNPDFVALGNVIKGFMYPDLVIIGESEPGAGMLLERIHFQLCENHPSISRMSLISAELAKVCLNAYITLKISFANSVANLCEQIPGANADAITKAIGADKRISPYYFRGGLSFGGTCFPRDTHAYAAVAGQYNVQADLIQAVMKVNEYQNTRLTETVLGQVARTENKTVGLLGLAFTPNTSVVTESPAIKLIPELIKRDLTVVAYDRLGNGNTRALFGSALTYTDSPTDVLSIADVIVMTLCDPFLKQVVESYTPDKPIIVVDGWRMIDPLKLHPDLHYVPMGAYLPFPYRGFSKNSCQRTDDTP